MSDTQSDTPVPYPSTVYGCPVGCQTGDVDNNNAQITDVWNISSRTVNEARIGFTCQLNFFTDLALKQRLCRQVGLAVCQGRRLPGDQLHRHISLCLDRSQFQLGVQGIHFDPSDVVTMIRGKHILHFGGELLAYQNNSTAWGNVNAGTYPVLGPVHAAMGS